MGRTLSVHTLLEKEYPTYFFSEEWKQTLGNPEKNFKMLIWGASGSGKTSFSIKLCKYLAMNFGKVYYNSKEQGEGKSLQDVGKFYDLQDCPAGSFMIGDRDTFPEMVEKLKKNRAKFVVIDSAQYINLTTEQYKLLIAKFPAKAFIIISWEGAGGAPKGEHVKAIRYMVDIKIYVSNGVAKADSRFGPTQPHTIFKKQSTQPTQLQLL